MMSVIVCISYVQGHCFQHVSFPQGVNNLLIYNIYYIENIKQCRINRVLLTNSKEISGEKSLIYRIRECLEKVRKEDRW